MNKKILMIQKLEKTLNVMVGLCESVKMEELLSSSATVPYWYTLNILLVMVLIINGDCGQIVVEDGLEEVKHRNEGKDL